MFKCFTWTAIIENMAAEEDAISKIVLETSNYFSTLVNYIPTKYYVPDEEEQNASQKSNRKRKKNQNKKLLSKKAKMLKLDPSEFKTTEELMLQIEQKENEFYNEEPKFNGSKRCKVSEIPSAPLDELRQKLHLKMQELKGKRPELSNGKKEHKKKTKEDQKIKNKKKRKENELSQNIKNAKRIEEKSIKNDQGDIVYSKFDFATSSTGNGATNTKKNSKNDLKKLLSKAENKKERIENLEKTDKEKAKHLKEQFTWEKAIKKAEGQKIRDDPKLLKKSIKRKEKMKDKNRKKWKERVDTVEKQKEERQKLRKQHIKERRDQKKKHTKHK